MKRQRPMRVLVAYDGSAGSEAVLEQLRRRRAGLPNRAQALVLTVADMVLITPAMVPGGIGAAPESVREMTVASRRVARASRERARRTAQKAASVLRRALPKWAVQSKAAIGSPSVEILVQAAAWHADLIVLGWRGQRLMSRVLLGSTAQRIVNEAPCSVRIVRGRLGAANAPVSLVIGVDGSSASDAAVRAMAARRWPAGSSARIVGVTDRKSAMAPVFTDMPLEAWEAWQREQRDWFTRHARRAADILNDAGCSTRVIVRSGDARRVLVDEADRWSADTLVVGATGLSGLARLFLGSVAAAVTVRAHCSVEIVRPRRRPL